MLSLLLGISTLYAQGISSKKTDRYNILDFGATEDSATVQTRFLQAAIDACFQQGGGVVIVPSGIYKTGTLILKDNVELHLSAGAALIASDDYIDFPMLPQAAYRSLKDVSGWSALLFACKAKNISVTGKGIIDGRGRGRKGRSGTAGGDRDGRPRNILFISCKNVFIEDVSLYNSAMWNQHYLDCEDVTVNNIRVYNHANGNNDGIDIDGCRRFILSNSIIDSDDDGIVLKSTGTAACENIIINNCIVSSFANAIKCGTESTGGFKNISISDCIVKPSKHQGERIIKSTPSGITAISLEIVDGGIMDGVIINNVLIEGTECPLYIRLANRGRKHLEEAQQPGMGTMRNITISNITAYGTGNFGSSVTGIAGAAIENVLLQNIRFYNRGGLGKGSYTVSGTNNKRHDVIKGLNFSTYWKDFRDVIEDEKGYPQPTVWQNLPSYGLFIRHVKHIEINNATFISEKSEPRNAVVAVNIGKLKMSDISLNRSDDADVLLHNVVTPVIDKSLKVRIEK
ncbi:MAG TPA: glycosyl hydrolase family 28 protein [Niabella sp.]|nr:glycosyl hydrolase family 28 protein [Niabella sp.]